ncbi:hypothetical protein [Zavarzinella formosa]|uniref:hypothetical protein n=1 Tax=Zavarzinella formosa TaxID=360055 RepID=UPI0002FD7C03|nr:hypothetical protein [Zavarzinella formosa]
MARQNRVTPFGEIVAVSERGTMMGNRGVLHDAAGHIRRPWLVKRWIICRLEFRERRRVVMSPDRYTELFFLDEATGLAAGHRPCVECRRKAFASYAEAWAAENPGAAKPKVSVIDERLHAERVGPDRRQRTFRATVADLPDGVFVTCDDAEGEARLLWKGRLLTWSPGGYAAGNPAFAHGEVTVLTPRSTVNVIRAGYKPEVHPSANDPVSVGA